MINCPENCNKHHKFRIKINDYDIYDCLICNHRFAYIDKNEGHTTVNYTDSYFFEGGTGGYPDYYRESEILYRRGQKYAKILSKNHVKPGRILDVGAAAGFVLKGFIDQGWTGEGIEPNKTMVEYANNELGVNVTQSSLEHFETKENFDCISLIQVIAHFYDLEKALFKITSLLKKDGYLLIETWNRDSITAKIFGWKWHEYSPPTVIHWFTRIDLIRYLENSGFRLVKKGRLLKKINSGHAKSLILEKVSNKILKKILNLIPNRINIIYPSEDLFYLLLQKK
jgi:SAM-dependent methyltransferase